MEVYEGAGEGRREYPPLEGNGHKFLYFSLAHYKAAASPNISDITANTPRNTIQVGEKEKYVSMKRRNACTVKMAGTTLTSYINNQNALYTAIFAAQTDKRTTSDLNH